MYLAIADDPGLDKMLSVLYLVLRKKGCSQEEKEWMAKPPAAKQVGEGGWVWGGRWVGGVWGGRWVGGVWGGRWVGSIKG